MIINIILFYNTYIPTITKKYIKNVGTYSLVLQYLTYSINDSIGCILDFFSRIELLKRKINSQRPTSGVEL